MREKFINKRRNLSLCSDKFGSIDLDSPRINEAPERDNNVQVDNDSDLVTSPPKTTTNAPSNFGPQFSKLSDLNKLVMRPSGNTIRLKCAAKGDPEPTIEWTKDGLPIERKAGQVNYNKWAITLQDLIPDDSGAYRCQVCNIHNCINFTTKLEVSGKYPSITISSHCYQGY